MSKRNKKLAAAPSAGEGSFSLISNEKLLALYDAMLRCRMLEQRIRKLGAVGSAASSGKGHEASVVGAVLNLLPGDAISPSSGGLAACLVRGVALKTIFSWLRSQPDSLPPRYAPRKIVAPGADLAAQLKAAGRVARLDRKAKDKSIVVLFSNCADLTRLPGLGFLRRAAAERLPILFVCHAKASKEEFAPKARNYGLPGFTVDGDDVVAVYRVVSEAMAHARRGNGPTFIECRPWAPPGAKKRGDAIANMEMYLSRKGLFNAEHKSEVALQFARELDKAAAARR
jgi:TPP-dependent pyruvate/acetoin dehydrogenase alpha subunit